MLIRHIFSNENIMGFKGKVPLKYVAVDNNNYSCE